MFILFTNLFLARPFRLENTLECYNLRGGQGGSTEVQKPAIKLLNKYWPHLQALSSSEEL